ncbi:threonine/serine dehydratase [Cyclobacteriaceae bacterium]|nr:threonine/serine dehydratase [Cyclobacteriaceae bacterium]
MSSPPTENDIRRAHERILPHIHNTPVLTSQFINELTDAHLFFKCENFQKTGSFKMRGASNALFSLKPEERLNGFATHSSGNHAQAVAYACKTAGVSAYIVMPQNAPKVKIDAVKNYGGNIVFCEPNETARQEACAKIIQETNAVFIPPFDDLAIIAGQASCAKELIETHADLDYLLTPVGGGGLAAGTALSVKYFSPKTEVILGEPESVNDTYLSLKAGKIIPVSHTMADGLKTTVGKLNFEIIQNHVKEVITVSEDEISSAMRMIWERMKIIIEPSCAVPFAALLGRKAFFKNKKVGIILTGGNVDLGNLPFV